MEIVGIDVGFGFTKAYNGKDYVIFKSLIGDANEVQFHSFLGGESSTANLHITLDNRSYFLGSYAELQSKIPEFTLDQETLIENFIKVLAITAAGLCSTSQGPLHVVTGLPVEYLRRDSRRLKEITQGQHEITYHNINGKAVTKQVNIDKLLIIPQPIGSIFNLIFDDHGNIRDNDLASQKLGVVDIGFKTTDLSIFDRLQYIERSSCTMDTGISKCFAAIANKLRQESSINLELYRFFKFIESGRIKIRGKEYNINNLKKKVYSKASATIASDLNRLWENDWDIDSIILTGGGSIELAEYLTGSIKGNVIPIQNNIDARLNNVQGYCKFGLNKWGSPQAEAVKERNAKPNSKASDPKEKSLYSTYPASEPQPDKQSKSGGWLKR